MKVVLFCGGMGMRLREHSESLPKPIVPIGDRPILWHLMKYYAHHGHKDFILCLGYKASVIKSYFLEYQEAMSNDFVLSGGGKKLHLLGTDIQDWTITFANTGLNSNIGQRLCAVQKYLQDDEVFLANYADGLTDFHLPRLTDRFLKSDQIASFLCVKSTQSFHVVSFGQGDTVTGIHDLARSGPYINGGYFALRKEIFKYIRDGEDLVGEPFRRLIAEGQLMPYKHDGFWVPMDTFKDKQLLEDMYARGNAPWEVWKNAPVTEEVHEREVPLVQNASQVVQIRS